MGKIRLLPGLSGRSSREYPALLSPWSVTNFLQALKQHEYYRLMTHRAEDVRSVRYHFDEIRSLRHRPNNSPFRIRTPGRIRNQSGLSPSPDPGDHAIFIGDLPIDVTEDQIREKFGTFGEIISVNIRRKQLENCKEQLLPLRFLANFS